MMMIHFEPPFFLLIATLACLWFDGNDDGSQVPQHTHSWQLGTLTMMMVALVLMLML